VATGLNDLATVLHESGQFDEVKAHYREALAIIEVLPNSKSIAICSAGLERKAYSNAGTVVSAIPLQVTSSPASALLDRRRFPLDLI